MTNYLKHKPGSIEEVIAKQTASYREDSSYQKMFKKELDKAGKGIGSMSDQEKKDFFNKIDKKYKSKKEKNFINLFINIVRPRLFYSSPFILKYCCGN